MDFQLKPTSKGAAAGAGSPLPGFDASDGNREILRLRLQQARGALAEAERRFQCGLGTEMDVFAGKREVEVLEAELAGDRVRQARAELDFAGHRRDLATARYEAGVGSRADRAAAETDVRIAEIQLREVEAKTKQGQSP